MSNSFVSARAASCVADPLEGMRHIGIVAGEASGDGLGASLIEGLRRRAPHIQITAMAGPRMLAAGCDPLAHIDDLSVMGLVEVLRHYPRLRRLRQKLIAAFAAAELDAFVSIDVPDFSLEMSRALKARGVPTVHLVCPQVWAWRQGRIPALRRALDRMLVLFPFEVDFLARHGIAADCIGHPLADQLPLEPDRAMARERLGLTGAGPVLALMPGSRGQEYRRHLPLFLAAAAHLRRQRPDLRILVGAVHERAAAAARAMAPPATPALEIITGRASEVLTAADVALCVSGTVTLEAALCQTPLVVAYRMPWLSYQVLRRLVRVDRIALPNLLMPAADIPELVQLEASPERLAAALRDWLDSPARVAVYRARCAELHQTLRRGAGDAAAAAVLALIAARQVDPT